MSDGPTLTPAAPAPLADVQPPSPAQPTGDNPAGGDPSPSPPAGDAPDPSATPKVPDWASQKFGDLATENAGLLEPYPDEATFLKAFRDNKTAARAKTEGMVKLPGEGSTPDEIGAFRRALGVPEAPDGYKGVLEGLTPPEGVELQEEALGDFFSYAHEKGFTPDQVRSVLEYDLERTSKALAGQKEEAEKAAKAATQAEVDVLRKSFGEEWQAKLQQLRDFVSGLGRDPNKVIPNAEAALAVDRVRTMLGEDIMPRGGASMWTDPEKEADAIIGDPKHPLHEKYVEGDEQVIQRVRELVIQARQKKSR